MANKAFLLDRDGVIIKNKSYLSSADEVEILPGVYDAIKKINDANYRCIVVTNQSGIARGIITLEQLHKIHDRISVLLSKQGARIDAFYYCPHHPAGKVPDFSKKCECRKPDIGLILQAARDYDLDLSHSILVGDNETDMQAGQKAGCKSFLLNVQSNKSVTLLDVVNEALRLSRK